MNAKKENPYNFFTSNKFLKHDKTYDIFCESTFGLIDKLSNKKSNGKKKIIKEINEQSAKPLIDLKIAINKHFHHKESNEIIMSIIVDGNYKKLIQQMKNSCLFAKKWKNWENPDENGMMKQLYDYFELLRKSKVPFLIIYCPRFYERTSKYYNPLSKQYIEDNDVETENKISNLESENAHLKQKINSLEEKVNNLLNNKPMLGRKKKRIRTRFKTKKSKGNISKKKRIDEDEK